jgi:hypothetical protein
MLKPKHAYHSRGPLYNQNYFYAATSNMIQEHVLDLVT